MCKGSDINCEVKVTELENGYQVQITGDKVKDCLKSENLKKCIEDYCSSKAPDSDTCCG